MQKWEYKVVALEEKSGGHGHIVSPEEEEKKLSSLGNDGWELVAVIPAVGADPHGLISNPQELILRKKFYSTKYRISPLVRGNSYTTDFLFAIRFNLNLLIL